MKKLILAFAFFCATSFAFASNSHVPSLSDNTQTILEDEVSLNFTVTGTNSEMLEELVYLQSTSDFDAVRVQSCTVTVTVTSSLGGTIKAEFTADDCPAASRAAATFLMALN